MNLQVECLLERVENYKVRRLNKSSLDNQSKQAYRENRQFFRDITYRPSNQGHNKPNLDIIREAVYGSKWRTKINHSLARDKSGSSSENDSNHKT